MNQALNQRDMFFKWLYYAGATLLLVLVQNGIHAPIGHSCLQYPVFSSG